MSELEELIHDLAKRGEISHISLTPRQIVQGQKKVAGWGATFAPTSSMGNTFAEDIDPVVALKSALTDAKLRRRAPFEDGAGAKVKPKKGKPDPATDADLADILG